MKLIKFLKQLNIELTNFKWRDFQTPEQKRYIIHKLFHIYFDDYFRFKAKLINKCNSLKCLIKQLLCFTLKQLSKFIKIILKKLLTLLIKFKDWFINECLYWGCLVDLYKEKIVRVFSYIVAAFIIVTIFINSFTNYEYYYCDKLLGVVRSPYEVYNALEVIKDHLASYYDADINLQEDITFKKVYKFGVEVDSQDDVLNTLTYMRTIQATGCTIYADNEAIITVKDEATADNILKNYKNYFHSYDDTSVTLFIGILNDIEIRKEKVLLGDIWDEDNALEYLIENKSFKLKYEICGHFYEDLDYGVSYMYQGLNITNYEFDVVKSGKPGSAICYEQRTIEDDIITNKEIFSSEIIDEPVSAKVLIKSYDTEADQYILPFGRDSYYYTSSPYGSRNGGHLAVDYACVIGTSIYSVCEGEVISAEYDENLGNCVMVRDSNGLTFIYGHLSELGVTEGECIAQGQYLGKSGRSGNATGQHLHLAVLDVNGDPFDVRVLFK